MYSTWHIWSKGTDGSTRSRNWFQINEIADGPDADAALQAVSVCSGRSSAGSGGHHR
jgi:hypothetical protein